MAKKTTTIRQACARMMDFPFASCFLLNMCSLAFPSPAAWVMLCDCRRINDFPFPIIFFFLIYFCSLATECHVKTNEECSRVAWMCLGARECSPSLHYYYSNSCLQTSIPVRRNCMEVIILNDGIKQKAAWFSGLFRSSTLRKCLSAFARVLYMFFTFHERDDSIISNQDFPSAYFFILFLRVGNAFTLPAKYKERGRRKKKNHFFVIYIHVLRSLIPRYVYKTKTWIYDAWNDMCCCCLLAKMAALSSFPVFRTITVYVHINSKLLAYHLFGFRYCSIRKKRKYRGNSNIRHLPMIQDFTETLVRFMKFR